MIVCNSCGKQNLITEYCQFCGARIMKECPVCDHLHPIDAIFCPVEGRNITEFIQKKEKEEKKRAQEKAEKIAKRTELENRYRESYKKICEKRFFYDIGSLFVSSMGSIILFISWIEPKSIPDYILTIFIALAIAGILSMFIEYFLLNRPARLEAWGPKPRWPEMPGWISKK
ncbi:hypothetical protein KKD19_02870 [Patescibacteria group bacterium]|nr:hypothetical protein [Patescibacteria group bacterium]MBU4512159.1 hypothetical protein [Patescibacteria group bacterium]MCG2693037.1 hypothetical protein [Candidatus Parcubacteria bacterium]